MLPYIKTDERGQQGDKLLEKKKKKKIFDFLFCTQYRCNGMFSSQLHLDQHRLSGAHDYSSRSTSMDNKKHSFAEKIKQSSHFLTNPGRSNSSTANEKHATPTSMLLGKKKDSAIPKWKKVLLFRKTQKHFDEIL